MAQPKLSWPRAHLLICSSSLLLFHLIAATQIIEAHAPKSMSSYQEQAQVLYSPEEANQFAQNLKLPTNLYHSKQHEFAQTTASGGPTSGSPALGAATQVIPEAYKSLIKQQYQSNLVKLSNTSTPLNLKAFASSYLQHQSSSANLKRHHQSDLHHSSTSLSLAKPKKSLLDKICIGTSYRLVEQHNRSDHYLNLVERYKDCTYVIGNLELTWLDNSINSNSNNNNADSLEQTGKELDLSFLESIKEITGYLLIAHVNLERIRIPNLQIIRGRDLFKLNDYLPSGSQQEEEFGLILIENELQALELPNLREILTGSFGSYYNNGLCHLFTIHSDKILNSPYKKLFVFNGTQPECAQPCDDSCQVGCWSEGPEMCQKSSKQNCHSSCSSGRCFGPLSSECCHPFCAGGCTGPKQTDCLACKNFYDDGECIQDCPQMLRYNPTTFGWEPNPDGKYAFGATCVKDCPEHLLRDNGACVRTCPPNKRREKGECVHCGGTCPKNCQGVEVVHSGNIDQLTNCTLIEGSITILDSSFTGQVESSSSSLSSPSSSSLASSATTASSLNQAGQSSLNGTVGRYKPMHPSRLEVFKTLKEITGYLNIQAEHQDFKNLSYFRNLKTIGGRQTTDMFHALSITKSSLVSLNLRSLRKVESGRITIQDNRDLCFADTIDWAQINITRREEITTRNNAELSKCRQQNLVCHEQCAQDGCWGPGPDECLSCNNYKLDDFCVDSCLNSQQSVGFLSYDSGNNTCKKCHSECRSGCNGVEAIDCYACKSVKDGPYCVSECPSHKYNNRGTCHECDKSCVDGCTGPSSKLGEGGCNSCAKAVINYTEPNGFSAHCIRAEDSCPDGYYQEYVGPQAEGLLKSSSGKPVCRKCHHRCKSCTGMGTHTSVCECAKYVAGEQCEDYCPRDYFANEQLGRCVKCSPECNGCFGPTEADCFSCRVYRIYYQESAHQAIQQADQQPQSVSARLLSSLSMGEFNAISSSASPTSRQQLQKFNCTAQCPAEKPHRISESNMLDPFCSETPDFDGENPRLSMLSSSSILIMLIISGSIIACVSFHRFQMEKDKTVKLSMHLSGIDDVEPLNPSNLKPNLAPLRSIKETELRRGRVLGKGVGGTVYQGFWYPEGQTSGGKREPRPVAIKVLKDNGQANLNNLFLDEAYIMASVDHPNLVRLLAVCVIPKSLMLITQLMTPGCLLDYVRNNKSAISSKRLLEWSKQIARGMAYLEERRMVHRDLALRNVLLQTPRKALISDFGLAKFLEIDQNEYQSGLGCVLPIRWLAPECISKRKFTHKSDVWAFGVTVWELLTFGDSPFAEYETMKVPKAINEGARLRQPAHVSVDVYKVMYSCWFYDPNSRPNFDNLVKAFTFFAKDPERFLISSHQNDQLVDPKLDQTQSDDMDCDSSDEFAESGDDGESFELEEDEATTARNLAAIPDLTPSTHNRLNEQMFGFDTQDSAAGSPSTRSPGGHFGVSSSKNRTHSQGHHNHHLHSQSQQRQHLHRPPPPHHIMVNHHDDDVFGASSPTRGKLPMKSPGFSATVDYNNNNMPATANMMDHERQQFNCWPIQHTISSNSLAQKSEQPVDMYDYLLPSSFAMDPESCQHSRHLLSSSNSTACASSLRNPPLSAGLVTNEEYFMNMSLAAAAAARRNSSNGAVYTLDHPNGRRKVLQSSQGRLATKSCTAERDIYQGHEQDDDDDREARLQSALALHNHHRHLSTSTGNIPHSLV